MRKYPAFALMLSVLIVNGARAQDAKNQSLLLRIQKDGGKPSFIFGTMHVSDKKAFNFKDSLYIYLRQADAFALEFNPDSANQILTAYLNGEFDRPEITRPSARSRFVPGDTTMAILPTDTVINSIVAINDTMAIDPLPPDTVDTGSSRQVREPGFLDRLINSVAERRDRDQQLMNTFMDAFLYEMARQEGKQIYGLEKMAGKAEVFSALSNGVKTEKMIAQFDKWKAQGEASVVHRLYLKEDLDSIALYYTEFFEESALDVFLYQRNREMVSNMEAIMKEKTLFAAVGAAHLPGEEGIIRLLQQKGYRVEPVMSEQRIAASTLQPDPDKRSWQTITREDYGFEFRLPGVPRTQDGTKGRQIVYHYDIGGGLLFMTCYGKLTISERKKAFQQIVTAHLDEWLKNSGGRLLSRKTLNLEGYDAVEALCMMNDKGFYLYREIVKDNLYYIFLAGSEKKENLSSSKALEYLGSFKTVSLPPSQWAGLSSSKEGFAVMLPGKPKPEVIPLDAESAKSIFMNSYSWFDSNSGIRYLISPGKTMAGFQYNSNEFFFEHYVNYLNASYPDVINIADSTLFGYPAKVFSGGTDDARVNGFIVKRNNTWYYVVAEYEGAANNPDVERFLLSFRLTEFEKPQWHMQRSPSGDFEVWMPGIIKAEEYDSTLYVLQRKEISLYGYDPYAAVTYYIRQYPVNPYFWAPNPDSIYEYWKNHLVSNWNDSLVSYSPMNNGGLESRELVKTGKFDKEEQVLRMVLNGDTMNVLSVVRPRSHADEENIKRFLESFRVTTERTPATILQNGPQKLFADLHSSDSIVFDQAYKALEEVVFFENDMELLIGQAFNRFPPPGERYLTVNDLLLRKVSANFRKLSPGTRTMIVNKVKEKYKTESALIDSMRFQLLGIVALDKTTASYELIKELLTIKRKKADYPYHLFSTLRDSLEHTKRLYPDLLSLVGDTTMGLAIVSLTRTMIDSNLLTREVLYQAKEGLVKLARWQQSRMMKKDFSQVYQVSSLLETLGDLNLRDVNDVIATFLKVSDNNVRSFAALALIKNNRPVPVTITRKIAADLESRTAFYHGLLKFGKEKLFPAEFRSQVSIAEGYVYDSYYEDDEGYGRPEVIYIKKIDYEYMGSKKRFYLFRVNLEYDEEEGENEDAPDWPIPEEKESYLAVAGPFDLDQSVISINEKENISGIWYEEGFDGMKNDYFFEKFIQQRLEWRKN